MAQRLRPCEVCGDEEGPSVFANEDYCSVFCERFKEGKYTDAQFEALTGKKFDTESGYFNKWYLQKSGK